jgi:hypothetical protein
VRWCVQDARPGPAVREPGATSDSGRAATPRVVIDTTVRIGAGTSRRPGPRVADGALSARWLIAMAHRSPTQGNGQWIGTKLVGTAAAPAVRPLPACTRGSWSRRSGAVPRGVKADAHPRGCRRRPPPSSRSSTSARGKARTRVSARRRRFLGERRSARRIARPTASATSTLSRSHPASDASSTVPQTGMRTMVPRVERPVCTCPPFSGPTGDGRPGVGGDPARVGSTGAATSSLQRRQVDLCPWLWGRCSVSGPSRSSCCGGGPSIGCGGGSREGCSGRSSSPPRRAPVRTPPLLGLPRKPCPPPARLAARLDLDTWTRWEPHSSSPES